MEPGIGDDAGGLLANLGRNEGVPCSPDQQNRLPNLRYLPRREHAASDAFRRASCWRAVAAYRLHAPESARAFFAPLSRAAIRSHSLEALGCGVSNTSQGKRSSTAWPRRRA
jgi:hypothetical protein